MWTVSGGERARVAARVRQLVAASAPAQRETDAEPDPDAATGRSRQWRPDADWVRRMFDGEPAASSDERSDRPALPQPSTGGRRPPPLAGTASRGAARLRDRVRWLPDSRGALGMGLAVLVALAATTWWVLSSRPHAEPLDVAASGPPAASGAVAGTVSEPPARAGPNDPSDVATTEPSGAGGAAYASPGPSGASAVSAAGLVVDVAGRVRRPGVYRLPAGSRVYQAIEAAGGARPGVSTTSLNLAALITDGEQIVVDGVHSTAQPPSGSIPAASSDAPADPPIDLNTATLEELESLPGVGPVLGQNILDWRNAHGAFSSVSQLQQVPGIGDVRMAQLQPLVSV